MLVFSMSAAPVDAHDIYMHLKAPCRSIAAQDKTVGRPTIGAAGMA